MFFISPMYLLFTIPALLLSFYAQYKVKSTFNKYAKVHSGRGMTGAQAARRILDANGLQHVGVEAVNGFLSDHYDPRSKVLRLSPDVYNTPSLSAVGVAAHEAGHALQDQQNYAHHLYGRPLYVQCCRSNGNHHRMVRIGSFRLYSPLLSGDIASGI